MASKKIIVANWKMNPASILKAKELYKNILKFRKQEEYQVVICPPFPFLESLKPAGDLLLGAQNLSAEEECAYTGEVSAQILKSLKVSYVILGHSERRAMGESDELISKKILQALKYNIKPVVCVGEKERDADGHFFTELKRQIVQTLDKVSKKQISKVIVAYEPLWAIGKEAKGAMAPHEIHETVIFIKKVLADKFGKNEASKVKILYGGSVDEKNTHDALHQGTTDGLLVGRASLTVESFSKILLASRK